MQLASPPLDATTNLAEAAPAGDLGRVISSGGSSMGGAPKLRSVDLPTAARPLFDEYLRYLDRRDFSPLTVKHYRQAAWQWLHATGGRQPDHVTVDVFVGGDPSTYTRVRSYIRWALAEGHYTIDPLLRSHPPRTKRGTPRPISETDFARAVHLADPRMRCWLLLAGKAGLRCKEIAGIRVEDIEHDATPPMLYVSNPKGSSYGHVPLHPDILRAFTAYGLPTGGYLFPGHKGRGFISPGYVSDTGNAYLKAVGIGATMHQLRHRCGSRVYDESGGDLLLTQRVLRHASVQSTQIYAERDVVRLADFFSTF